MLCSAKLLWQDKIRRGKGSFVCSRKMFYRAYRLGFWIEREAGDRPYDIYCEFQARGALRDMFVGLASDDRRWKDAVPFLRAAEKSEKLKSHYSFYSEDNPGWLYGCWPHDKELRSWSDDLLARAIDADFCREFARKIANCLQTLLEEAEEVNGSL